MFRQDLIRHCWAAALAWADPSLLVAWKQTKVSKLSWECLAEDVESWLPHILQDMEMKLRILLGSISVLCHVGKSVSSSCSNFVLR